MDLASCSSPIQILVLLPRNLNPGTTTMGHYWEGACPQVTTSIASYVGHDPAHAMDGVHQVATLLGGWIGAVTLTGEPATAPALQRCLVSLKRAAAGAASRSGDTASTAAIGGWCRVT